MVTIDPDTGDTTFTAAPGEQNNLEVNVTTIDDGDGVAASSSCESDLTRSHGTN